MMRISKLLFLTLAFAVMLAFSPAQAQTGGMIRDVRVEGAQRIETATVLSYMTVRPGEAFDPDRINDSLKALFATGFFSDVSFFRQGNSLIVSVIENPMINEVAYEGNDQVKDEELRQETQLNSRMVYTRSKVQEDVQRLLQIYRRLGNYAATIDPKIIKLDQNRVNLVYEIHEGEKTKVRAIKFVGNEVFDDDTLRDSIQTKEARWYRFLSADDNYDRDRIAYDEELLRKFYLSRGYADFNVESSVAELTPDQKDFFVTYTISEGPRYKLGAVDINSQLRGVDTATLKPMVTTVPGDWYNADKVDSSITSMTDGLANQQFAFVDIRPQISLDREKHLVNLVYAIKESPRVFIERINIANNTRTLDEVIRREMQLVEGDPFNRTKLKRSEQRIRDLGFFKDVKVKVNSGSRPDLAVIDVTVEEQSTGELSIGAGFSTANGPLADFRIREKNLLGKGQDLSLSTTISARTNQYDLRFTEPYFLDKNLSAGVDLFQTTTDYQDESSFDQQRTGGGLRLGYPLAERWRQDLHYTLEDNNIENVRSTASRYIRDQAGKRITSEVGHTVTYSTLDSKLDPTEGWNAAVSNDFAGLGGDARYLANKLRVTNYRPLSENRQWILNTGGEVGYIFGIGRDVQINERYFLGGGTFRGFDVAGMGPRDAATFDALGGNRYAKGTVELTTPLGGATKSLGLRSHFFTDFGTLGQVDNDNGGIIDDESLRLSAGFGVSWRSPLGPLRGDLAFPLIKEEYDEERIFNFNFGTRF